MIADKSSGFFEMKMMRIDTKEDYKNYVARLCQCPKQVLYACQRKWFTAQIISFDC